MRTNARTPDYKIAEVLGVSQGYYSKLQVKIAEKMRAGRKRWREQNGTPEFDEPFISYTPSYPPANRRQRTSQQLYRRTPAWAYLAANPLEDVA